MRKLRAIGLSACAALAISATIASAANAAEGTFVVSAGSSSYAATQVGVGDIWTLVGGRTLTCTTVTVSGTVANGNTTLTATPTYAGCHVMVGPTTLPATFETTGCDYRFSDLTTTGSRTYAAKTDLLCPEGQAVHVRVYANHSAHTAGTRLCEYTIDPQNGVTGAHFTDNANGTLSITWTSATFATTRTFGTTANCGEALFNSSLSGSTLMTVANGTVGLDD